MRGGQEVDGAFDFDSLGGVAGERKDVERLAGGEGVSRGFGELTPSAVGSLQGEQLVDRRLQIAARLADSRFGSHEYGGGDLQ